MGWLQSGLLVYTSRLLAYIQLPSLMDLTVETSDCPPGSVRSFLEAVQTACITHSIMSLKFSQYSGTLGDILSFDDLRPMMAFRNLCLIDIDVFWNVDLTGDGLLELTSTWSYLEHLCINEYWGWGADGITLDGLVQLLQACRSLGRLCLAIDTRGYTQVPPNGLFTRIEWDSAPVT